ncbi:MAG: hypothetical protein ACREN5_15045, partial [Gemmatimonadales bacterium]
PNDSAWGGADTYWFPLVGQVIERSRWFAPAVSGVWVQAVHTRDSLALRVVWDDRSRSPDSSWLAHVGRVFAALTSDVSALSPPPSPPSLGSGATSWRCNSRSPSPRGWSGRIF